jgi:hypothetical protein
MRRGAEVASPVTRPTVIEHEQQKKNIGERWAETSCGKALFFWAVKKDEHGRDVHRQLQDKLAKS